MFRFARVAQDAGSDTVAIYANQEWSARLAFLAHDGRALNGDTSVDRYLVLEKFFFLANNLARIRSIPDRTPPRYMPFFTRNF